MCYRYSNTQEKRAFQRALRLQAREEAKEDELPFNFYHTNGFAHEALPVVTMEQPEAISWLNWGLVPSWVKSQSQANDLRKMTLNAQCEGVFDKPSWKGSIMGKRCLIPATGFFEWHTRLGLKIPFLIMVKDKDFPDSDTPFCFGGLYASCKLADGTEFNTFSIITTPANEKMEFIHNTKKRMPLIIDPADYSNWLEPRLKDAEIKDLMQPYPNQLIRAFTIGKSITAKGGEPNSRETLIPASYEGFEEWIS